MTFDLHYLVDNGRLSGWLTDTIPNCRMVQWRDDKTYSVLAENGEPLGWGDTKDDALSCARLVLTDRRRKADGVIPAKIC